MDEPQLNPKTGYPITFDEPARQLAERFGLDEEHLVLRPALAACELDVERAAAILRRYYKEHDLKRPG